MQPLSGHDSQFRRSTRRTRLFVEAMAMLSVLPKVTLTWDATAALWDLDIDRCILPYLNHPHSYEYYVNIARELERKILLAYAILDLVHRICLDVAAICGGVDLPVYPPRDDIQGTIFKISANEIPSPVRAIICQCERWGVPHWSIKVHHEISRLALQPFECRPHNESLERVYQQTLHASLGRRGDRYTASYIPFKHRACLNHLPVMPSLLGDRSLDNCLRKLFDCSDPPLSFQQFSQLMEFSLCG